MQLVVVCIIKQFEKRNYCVHLHRDIVFMFEKKKITS